MMASAPAVSPQNLQQLMGQCQGLVRSMALQISRKFPPHVELEDLIEYGQVGLAEAARDFDPSRGGQFSTYAYYRVRGAIYDGMAKMAWYSRSRYQSLRYEQKANELLRDDAEQGPAESPPSTEGETRWFRDLSRALTVIYLVTEPGDGGGIPADALVDASAEGPAAAAMGRETSEKLLQLIEALPPQESALIKATYFEGLTLQEAGHRLGIGKGWASRLHARVLQRLARSLQLCGAAP
jgi:RNA polymerase sigma factor for flagellar operon FliA